MNHAQLAVAAVIELARWERDAAPGTFRPVPHEVFSRRLLGNDRGFQKQFQALRRAGILSASRGPTGGYRLASKPDKVRILAVYEALCEDVLAEPVVHHEVLAVEEFFAGAENAYECWLDRLTIADALARIPKQAEKRL